jgi:Tfp pilus assembly PilM family ATPase
MREQRLPLGIDLGANGIRICEISGPRPRVQNILTSQRAAGSGEAEAIATLRALLAEMRTRERRCVMVLDDRDAVIRELSFPPMSRAERMRAAQIEAERFAPVHPGSVVTLSTARERGSIVGATAKEAIDRLIRITRAVKLRLVGIDHAGYALRRVYPAPDAIVDIGLDCTRFYTYGSGVPFMLLLGTGGAHFTRAVAESFSIDIESAEGRKRMHGSAPAAEHELTAIAHFVGRAMRAARQAGIPDIERILLTGNGSRGAPIRERLTRDTGCIVETAERIANCTLPFPEDVVRAATSEWGLACGAALWSFAEDSAP